MTGVQPCVLVPLILSLILAFITDLRSHKIPNWLTYPIIVLAIISYFAVNGFKGLLFSAGGLGLGLGLLMPIYMIGGMGAGDVKLMGAVGAALGPVHLFYAFLCTAIAGGIYAAVLLLSRAERAKDFLSRLYTAFLVKELRFSRLEGEGRGLKLYYGLAISIGTLAYIFLEAYRGNIEIGFQVFM